MSFCPGSVNLFKPFSTRFLLVFATGEAVARTDCELRRRTHDTQPLLNETQMETLEYKYWSDPGWIKGNQLAKLLSYMQEMLNY